MLFSATAGLVALLHLVKQIEFANAARPEIIATTDRCYVVYLLPSASGNTFNVKIFDRDLTREIADKTLVTANAQYGHPTDIRVIADNGFAYAFFETTDEQKTFLWAAKFTLSDDFTEVARRGPIATSTMFKVAKPGDEKLDDPAPLIRGSDLYVMTRFKSSYAIDGATRYKLRHFDTDLNPAGSDIDLDLSAYADGEARQSSILWQNGRYYVAVTTTTGAGTVSEAMWTFPSDVLIVELDENWNIVSRTPVADDSVYTEAYVTGLRSDGRRFYLTYNRVILGREFSSVVDVFDAQWNRVGLEPYLTLEGADGKNGLRPSIEVSGRRVYAGNDDAATHKALIYIFETDQPARRRAVAH